MKATYPMLWFDTQAEDAAKFYCGVFPNSRIKQITHYPAGMPGGLAGKVMTVDFELNGEKFVALNGGPQFKFTEAISLVIPCDTQEEIDHYWSALTGNGGQESMCGWLKDRYGLSWQVAPSMMGELLSDKDPAKAQRVVQAFMQMRKFDIAAIKAAAQ
jgi:predicted 3-demethylubiquinone-9 3-methyltransferase (glyoxalase superfamily)